jgi:hypothetical protein
VTALCPCAAVALNTTETAVRIFSNRISSPSLLRSDRGVNASTGFPQVCGAGSILFAASRMRCRPTAQETAALRAAPVAHRLVSGDVYRLSVPETFTTSGLRAIPEQSRRVQTWGGFLCGDAHTVVAVNVTPLDVRSLADSVRSFDIRRTESPNSCVRYP